MRLFFFAFLTIVLVAFLLNSFVNYQDFQQNSLRLVEITKLDLQMPYFEDKLHDVAFVNNNVYNSSIVSPAFNSSLQATVRDIYDKVQTLKVSTYFKLTIFDSDINVPVTYMFNGTSGAPSGVNGIAYDEIDIVFKSIQTMESIMVAPLENFNLSNRDARYMR
jgi:hypothetical protein